MQLQPEDCQVLEKTQYAIDTAQKSSLKTLSIQKFLAQLVHKISVLIWRFPSYCIYID